MAKEELVEAAVRAREAGAMRFCLVNSGRGPTVKETERMADAVAEIKRRVPINICACMGLLTESKARILKEAGVERVNHNLNTSSRYHPEVVTTHTYEDRVATLESVKAADCPPAAAASSDSASRTTTSSTWRCRCGNWTWIPSP